MCVPGVETALAALAAGGGATAAGATAAAGTAITLKGIGTALAIGGSLAQGIATYQTARANAALIEQQKLDEAQLFAVKDQRERTQFASAIAQQRAELAARGIQLDSPTAVYLGQTAAQEMAFNSQSVRSTGQSRQTELTAEQMNWRARGTMGLLKGGFGAAGALLNAKADNWAGLEG